MTNKNIFRNHFFTDTTPVSIFSRHKVLQNLSSKMHACGRYLTSRGNSYRGLVDALSMLVTLFCNFISLALRRLTRFLNGVILSRDLRELVPLIVPTLMFAFNLLLRDLRIMYAVILFYYFIVYCQPICIEVLGNLFWSDVSVYVF